MNSEEQLERKAEADAMPLDSAIGNLKGLADGTIEWGYSIPSECATASVDVALTQLAEVTRQLDELVEAVMHARTINAMYPLELARLASAVRNASDIAARIQSAQPKEQRDV